MTFQKINTAYLMRIGSIKIAPVKPSLPYGGLVAAILENGKRMKRWTSNEMADRIGETHWVDDREVARACARLHERGKIKRKGQARVGTRMVNVWVALDESKGNRGDMKLQTTTGPENV